MPASFAVIRAFVAVPLPAPTRSALVRAREAFVGTAPDWAGEKWVAEENLHVTLRFLGGISESAVDAVVSATAAVCAGHHPFALALGALTGTPAGRARMLWARVTDGAEPCRRLAAELDAALAPACGLEPESRGFVPHVTLARLRRPRHVPADALAAAGAALDTAGKPAPTIVSVRGVSVVSSRTLREGPVYEEIAFVPLTGRD